MGEMETLSGAMRQIISPPSRSAELRAVAAQAAERANNPGCAKCSYTGWLSARVPQHSPDFGRWQPCQCREQLRMQQTSDYARALRNYSNLGLLERADLSDPPFDGNAAFESARGQSLRYAESPDGWLTLVGPHGCGKTYLLSGIVRKLIESAVPAMFLSAGQLLDQDRDRDRRRTDGVDWHDVARKAPVLALDDVPADCGPDSSDAGVRTLLDLIGYRHARQMATALAISGESDSISPALRARIADHEWCRVAYLGEEADRSGFAAGDLRRGMTFESYDPTGLGHCEPEVANSNRKVASYVHNWAYMVARSDAAGILVLMGGCGVGKTHLATAALGYLENVGKNIYYTTTADLLDTLRSGYGHDDQIARLRSVDALILDDFGAERSTAFAEEKLFQIVSYRYERRLSMMVITPQDLDDIRELRPRLHSRLSHRKYVSLLLLQGPDYRLVEC